MDAEIPVLAGFLNVPTQSGFSLKKKSTQRYCLLFKSSRHGIERLEICENKDDKNPKIITLENCVKITQEPVNQIQIVKMTGTLTLNAITEDDLKEWITALQTVAFRDKGGGRNATIEEENDLYCSSFGDGLFIVKLIPSETSIRCQIESKNYMLHLTATELQLKSAEDLNIIIAKWPFRFIRKYGYRDGKFTFEAGRKCSTGEGVFTLDHTNPREIFRCMSSKMKSMRKLISGESLNSLDCGENQLTAALSMEAGSRSPLPPSPNHHLMHQNSNEFDQSLSCVSIRGFLSSNDSLNNVSMTANSNVVSAINNSSTKTTVTTTSAPSSGITKQIPNKPPRKLPGSSNLDNQTSPSILPSSDKLKQNCDKFSKKKFQSYEPVSIVSDAQKTASTVILKSVSPELTHSTQLDRPPDLPLRNDNSKKNSPGSRTGKGERDYECIENITDAWKTLGMADVKHVEHVATADDDLREFEWQRTQSQRENNRQHKLKIKEIHSTPTTPTAACNSTIVPLNGNSRLKLIENLEDVDSNYDRLDFLQKNNKNSDSSGYKTIVTVSSAQPQQQGKKKEVIINDYELIASPDIQTCRLADDSYLGYGVLRQPSVPGPQVACNSQKNISTTIINETGTTTATTSLGHKNYNGMSYAIVSKPKRV